MEEELLNEMILDRETTIRFLERKILDQDKKEERMKKKQVGIKEKVKTNRVDYRKELTELRHRYGIILRQYHDTKDALDTKKTQHQIAAATIKDDDEVKIPSVPGLHVYNNIMNSVDTAAVTTGGGGVDSSSSNYVVRMQSQLCRAMHGMGIMETQLQLTRKQSQYHQKKLRDTVTEMIEEKSQSELKLVNELIVKDNLRVEVETKREEQHTSFFKEKCDLMEKVEREMESLLLRDDDDKEEEENEVEKEELKKILQHGKKEIIRLEQENDERDKEVESLKEKAMIAQGKDVVDDIVTSIAEEFADPDDDDDSDNDSND